MSCRPRPLAVTPSPQPPPDARPARFMRCVPDCAPVRAAQRAECDGGAAASSTNGSAATAGPGAPRADHRHACPTSVGQLYIVMAMPTGDVAGMAAVDDAADRRAVRAHACRCAAGHLRPISTALPCSACARGCVCARVSARAAAVRCDDKLPALPRRLRDVENSEGRLYLVFEWLDKDLKKFMDSCPGGLSTPMIKVRRGGSHAVGRVCTRVATRITAHSPCSPTCSSC